MQIKKIGCKQKRSDANKKDRMQTKNQNLSRCKQKDRMQTKKIGCKQKRICKLKRKWNNVERARADTMLPIFRVN